ncbi:acyl-CoA dehydrogenase family protein [Pseudonocardia benzenivorans]|uniref:Acyl-CoA dehydrogenase family protein n=1 Tax=Pseudonocardia benzenivorans TaxID=228005 RepID=A0ABW3VQ10_9PSEU
MNVGLPADEYDKLRESVFTTIWNELDPLEHQIEDTESIPYDVVLPALRACGAFGLIIPRDYGGAGLSIAQYLPILAEFAKIQGGIRAIVHVHNSFAHALSEIGSEEQKQAILPGAAVGEKSLAFALTEPGNGTGMDLSTRARRDGDEYVLDGRKWLITNSDIASHFLVLAKTADREVSAIIVPRDAPGFTIAPLPETMGCKGAEHGELTFTDVRVPAANLVGAEGEGIAHLERALEISRVFIAASSLGTATRALDLSLRFAKERVTFGRPIGERQAIQRYLAEMATDVYALRGMLADVAAKWDRDQRVPAESSLVKQFGLEAVGRVTDRALLVHGGIGYTRKYPIERLYRDARLNWLEEGPPTVQYLVAARQLLDGFTFDDAFDSATR